MDRPNRDWTYLFLSLNFEKDILIKIKKKHKNNRHYSNEPPCIKIWTSDDIIYLVLSFFIDVWNKCSKEE